MPPTRRSLLASLGTASALTIAGCAGNGGGGDTTTTTTTTQSTTTTSTATSTTTESGTVQVTTHDSLGEILVDAEGRTLYMFDQDTQGSNASSCYDSCASAWPPLTTDGSPTTGDGVMTSLSTFEREGGSTQVAANGWPLYYFANDTGPGDVNGQGISDVWWVLGPDGTPKRGTQTTTTTTSMDTAAVGVRSDDDLGDILVDGDGMTLYMFDTDQQGSQTSSCTGSCTTSWPPLTTDGDVTTEDGVTAPIATFDREDGSTQVAANGWPLYGYAQDGSPGDTTGQGVGDVWWVLAPDGTPRRATSQTTTTTTTNGDGIY